MARNAPNGPCLRWALAEGPTVGFGLFRIIVGLMAIRHLMGYARDWVQGGFFGKFFYYPYAAWIPQPTEAVYVSVLFLGILSAACLVLGLQTRVAAVLCFLMVAYHLSLNQIWYRHNRYFLVLALLLVAVAPVRTALSLDALRMNLRPVGPSWPRFLIKAQMTLIYLASALSKTLDAGWRGGDVLAGRNLGKMWSERMPDFVTQIIPPDLAVRLLTTQALVSEFSLAMLLWFPRTRRLAIWWGIIFHGYIEVQWSVLTFTYLTLGTYFVFDNLRCGEKVWVYSERSAFLRLVARVLPFLDWLFQIRLASHSGKGQRFVDRDGTTYRGWMGWIMLGANLPISYVLFYPLSWLRGMKWQRDRETLTSTPVESPNFSVRWLVGGLAFYLAFLALGNLYLPLRIPPEARRFWDLPWFFMLMCTMAGAYRRSMVNPSPLPALPAAARAPIASRAPASLKPQTVGAPL